MDIDSIMKDLDEKFKCSNVHWHHFSTYGRIHYYIGDTPPNGATNTGNININYDEGVFENILDDGE